MEEFLFNLHSGIRWLVVAITVIALAKVLLGIVQKSKYDQLTFRIMIAFSGLITVQWVIGVILLLVLGDFDVSYRWEHAVIMTIAIGVAHMHMRFKSMPGMIRFRSSLVIIVVVLALVYVGVARLPQGWA